MTDVSQSGDSDRPPVQCGNCGAEIKFEHGQLVGDPAAVETVKRYQEALERIAGPTDRPFLGVHGKLAAKALGREPASPEAIAARAKRDYDQYVNGISLLKPSVKGPRDD